MIRSGNPTLRAFQGPQTWSDYESQQGGGADAIAVPDAPPVARSNTMTINGTIHATMILLGLCAGAGLGTWMFLSARPEFMFPILLAGFIGAIILALVISFKPRTAPVIAPVYAIVEGGFLGSVSLFVASLVGGATGPESGIIFQAIVLTFGILFALLTAFRAGLVRIGQTAAMCMYAGLGGIFVLYAVGIVMMLMGQNFPLFHEMFGFGQAGWIGIGFSLFVIVLASFFLVLDFQLIENGVKTGAPKYMEWYGGFALLVTLAWLYFEILRLLAKLRAAAD